MLNFAVTNVGNNGREVFIWHRIGKDLRLYKDPIFYPYYYQVDQYKGLFKTIDGKKVSKVFVRNPGELAKRKDENTYETDIHYCTRYCIDKIGQFLKADIKYSFIDIEVKCDQLPTFQDPKYPITCISCSNSYTEEIKTFSIVEESQEKDILDFFVKWIKEQQFDFLTGWNFTQFDWQYLRARYYKLFGVELAEVLSPIFKSRPIGSQDKEQPILIPVGLGIVDYLVWFKKIYKGRASYSLDNIAQEELKESAYEKVNFNEISEKIKVKNINDIKRLVAIEKKLKIVAYYDELRRMSKADWMALDWNSKILDVMLLSEAKQKNIILPNKKYGEEIDSTFEGAYRRCNTGFYKNLWKLDLSSAYPQAIINFCLDIQNIKQNEGTDINGIKFYQNSSALLPSLAKKLINKKDELKKQLKELNPESIEAKDLQTKYDAVKGVVNSLFGVCGLKVFRLFDVRVAASITYLIRDLLHYVENKLKAQGINVIYIDTDSVMCDGKENPKDLCNDLVKQWAKEKYNKDSIDISFDLEGKIDKIMIIALCRYVAEIETKTGIKKETKGIEAKRVDSSRYTKWFQETLIAKIMNEESREAIESFIASEKEAIKTKPLIEVGFPCKITKSELNYKSPPVFLRGLDYTKELIPTFNKSSGELFYYIQVEPFGEATRKSSRMKTNKETGQKELQSSETVVKKDILCFDSEQQHHIKNIDWSKVVERSIDNKVNAIFEAMNWLEVKEKKVKKLKEDILCEVEVCKKNKKQICTSDKVQDCPKNNEQSIYEDENLLKKPISEKTSIGVKTEIDDIDKQIEELQKKKEQIKNCGSSLIAEHRLSKSEVKVQSLASAPNIDSIITEKFNVIQENKKQIEEDINFDLHKLEIKELDFKTTKEFISKNHYSHTLGSGTKANIGFFYNNELVTAIVYGNPIGINVGRWMQVEEGSYAELVRVFSQDGLPKNTESFCLARSFEFLKVNNSKLKYLISYADPTHGHVGYIYQATNWYYVGKQGGLDRIFTIDGKQVHRRTANATYGTSSVRKLKELLGNRFEVTITYPKHIYLMCIGNKKERKEWYSKFKQLSYPKIKQEVNNVL